MEITAPRSLAQVDQGVLLTSREQEILQHLINGLSSREIAQRLYISRKTVEFHLMNVYRKLQVTSKMQAIYKAIQIGLVSLDYLR